MSEGRGIVEGDRLFGRLADRRPGELVEQHLPVAGRVGVARDGQRAERLAWRRPPPRSGTPWRRVRDHREAERPRQVGAEASAIAGHVRADAVHHDHLEDRPLRPSLPDRRIAVLALEHRQNAGECWAAHLALPGVYGGFFGSRQQPLRDPLAEAGAAGQQPCRQQGDRILVVIRRSFASGLSARRCADYPVCTHQSLLWLGDQASRGGMTTRRMLRAGRHCRPRSPDSRHDRMGRARDLLFGTWRRAAKLGLAAAFALGTLAAFLFLPNRRRTLVGFGARVRRRAAVVALDRAFE